MTFNNAAARDRCASLAGATILVAEDDALVGLEVTLALQDFGCTVLGPLASVDRTLAALEVERPDAALLDVGLADGHSAPVAALLTAGGVPFAFLTGYEDADLGIALSNLPLLAKPFGSDALEGVVLQLLADVRSEEPQPLSEQGRPRRVCSSQ